MVSAGAVPDKPLGQCISSGNEISLGLQRVGRVLYAGTKMSVECGWQSGRSQSRTPSSVDELSVLKAAW